MSGAEEFRDFRRIADAVAADIARGRLRPGDRLPPQRLFARRRRIAPSTASRVYGELVRRGLVVGEVGRGTFVRAVPEPTGRALTESPVLPTGVNLELNYPSAPGQSELLSASLAPLLRPDVFAEATQTAAAAGTPAARAAASALLACGSWRPAAERVLFTGTARQAIAGALAALVPPGGRVGVEALTYPVVREIAARLQLTLVPLTSDAHGVRPEAVAAAHRGAPLSALYVQPTLHNPTCVTMPEARRRDLAATVRELGLPVVEDRIWSFLYPGTADAARTVPDPFAAFAPEWTYVVDGLSKRIAPGLSVGLLVTPGPEDEQVAAALRSGGWTAGRFALEAATRWLTDGTADRLARGKRADAAARHALVTACLTGHDVHTDPYAYFAWWRLPAPWRGETFTAAAAAQGIAVTPGSTFAAGATTAPDAVRIGLASPPYDVLETALRRLVAIAETGPGLRPPSGPAPCFT
ncbi:PLP-dependent aminotransferase family protein [Streptomyces sp. B-S-A8]|uniref:PLP-dependent aminotransferase family protein n=1 Tax=Streptomyces solicavernae TaxID=3043614 RepID=A0ABT6RJX8_9ACTN|nr:PLP-dependent aminotransferase family protein [Streptomyces sp. B-S-A8]MDI3384727.1 PLP-dependent aminotransferase family protein [Streptomyces sp. B-S-A8]